MVNPNIRKRQLIMKQNFEELFLHIISKGKKDNTYKFALAKFLLDTSLNCNEVVDTKISYVDIAEAYLKYYWFQECKYKIKQDFKQSTQPILISIIQKYCGTEYIPDSYKKYFKKNQYEKLIIKEIEKKCLSDVIPRFQPIDKNLFYEHNHIRSLKKFKIPDVNQKYIILKKDSIKFFKDNYQLLHKALILEWAKFLEKTNFTPKLISKIENLGNTKRSSLNKFKKILFEVGENKNCFYCNKKLEKQHIHVDHFIPWSYVYEDEIWNLVLSCSKCNLVKSDLLAEKVFLKKIKRRNEELNFIKENKDIEDYYNNCKQAGFLVFSYQ